MLVAMAALPGRASETTRIRVLHFGNLEGQFARLACDSTQHGRVDFSNLITTLRDETASVPSLVLASGAVLGDSPFFNFLVRQGPTGIANAASILAPAGAALFVPGIEEFSIPFRGFLEHLPDLESAGIRYRIRNIACAAGDVPCNLLAAQSDELFRVGDVQVGVVPLVSADVGKAVHPENVRGLELVDPFAMAAAETARLRELGADLVVLLVDMEVGGVQGSRTLELLGSNSGADLVVAGGLVRKGEEAPVLLSARNGTGSTLLVASPRAPDAVGRVTISMVRKGGRWVVERAEPVVRRVSPFARLQSVSATVSRLVSEACSLGRRTLRKGTIDPPMTRDEFIAYVMEIMRRKVHADAALLSVDSIRLEPGARIGGEVTSGMLFKTFSKHGIVILEVAGDDLASFVNGYLDAVSADLREELFLLGATRDPDGTVKINDRAVNPKRRYEIVTTDFIASGGRGLGQPLVTAPRTDREDSGYFIEEVVTEHFDRTDGSGKQKLGLARDFPSLWLRPLWEGSLSATGSFSNVAIENEAAYDQAQLSRSTFNGFKGEGQLWLTVSTRDHKVADFTKAQYGMARTGDADLSETQDLAIQELSYTWTHLRNVYGRERFFVPAPVVRARLESEFSRAEEAEHHHLEGTGAAGLEWLFGTKASAGVTYGVRRELLDDADSFHAGVNVFYQINSLPLVTFNQQSAITVDSRFELFYADWRTDDTLKGIGSTKLSATLWGNLALTLGFDIFLYREEGGGLAWSLDSTAGLSVGWDTALQQF
jgi:2',3'-cyclic-nucleotide 2'-phosphodiesterase (5'-nucleotidase family)